MKIVIDTNVLFTALKSNRGASYKLVSLIPSKEFSIAISVPLIIEYEAILRQGKLPSNIIEKDITDFIDYLCQIGEQQDIFFLWRPFLPDPFDDLVLEVAVAGDCEAIITYNKKHFTNVEKFGLRVLTPKELLTEIGVIS
jgi:putative PIN family toxin of toxin-antitoxin system